MSRASAPAIGPVCRTICHSATLYAVALTIERVALLRRVELFAGTPDRVLAGIARVLEEVICPAGAVIMEAGAVEDWLFVVEHGEVEVIRPDRRVPMGVGSVVGELAVLDAQPEIARHKSPLGSPRERSRRARIARCCGSGSRPRQELEAFQKSTIRPASPQVTGLLHRS